MSGLEYNTTGGPAPSTGVPGTAPAIDFESFFERCAGDVALLLRFAGVFQEQAALDMARIEKALGAGDFSVLRQVAHRLRGSSAYLSAESVCAAAERLEAVAAEEEIQRAAEAVARLRAAMTTCLTQVQVIREQAELMASGAGEVLVPLVAGPDDQ